MDVDGWRWEISWQFLSGTLNGSLQFFLVPVGFLIVGPCFCAIYSV